MKDSKKPKKLDKMAVFPLNTVCFPGHSTPLKIFEKKYKTMLKHNDASGNKQFIISLISSGSETEDEATPYRVGTLVEYDEVIQTNELSFVTPKGVKRVYLENFIRDEETYLTADYFPYLDGEQEKPPISDFEYIEKKLSNMWISGSSAQSKESLSKLVINKDRLSPENYSLFFCGCLNLPLINQQHLLESKSMEYRIKNLLNVVNNAPV